MTPVRLVVDTNVLVAAVRRGTVTRQVMETWLEGRTRLLVSHEIIEEYLRVLSYPKFRLSPQEIRDLMEKAVLPYAEVVGNPPRLSVEGVDADDVKFLACGVSGHARYLVTGDQGLLKLQRYRDLQLISPADLLGLLRESLQQSRADS